MTGTDSRWRRALISPEATLAEAIENINTVAIKLALCVDAEGRLIGSVTDGDLRRGLLRGVTMQDPVREIANPNPLVVPEGADRDMVRAAVRQCSRSSRCNQRRCCLRDCFWRVSNVIYSV